MFCFRPPFLCAAARQPDDFGSANSVAAKTASALLAACMLAAGGTANATGAGGVNGSDAGGAVLPEIRIEPSPSPNDLVFASLASQWDEGLPLGNGIIGALVWQKGKNLRLSLDHVALWDLRSKPNLLPAALRKYNYKWVEKQVLADDYKVVQDRYDAPYDRVPFQTKIPGAALEFDTAALGAVAGARLFLKNALCEVKWASGARLQTFVHAMSDTGWFYFENVPAGFEPVLVPPAYGSPKKPPAASAKSAKPKLPPLGSLATLGYEQGTVFRNGDSIVYHQTGAEGFSYAVRVTWRRDGSRLAGVWTIEPSDKTYATPSSHAHADPNRPAAGDGTPASLGLAYSAHRDWWEVFWNRSRVSLPDKVIEKQYYADIYKFGSAARPYSPPISLQAVWTADNGRLPPWAGDFHNDLNTQLSYWPAYTGNYLSEAIGYLEWLLRIRPVCRQYTRDFFGVDGLNVPGVCALNGAPMGGWIQYAFSPTTAAWLAHHFHLQWEYTRDINFLRNHAYPYLTEAANFLLNISRFGTDGKRRFPLSSSPEIFNNSRRAWFTTTTNYDLALARFLFLRVEEAARLLGDKPAADKWYKILFEWPEYELDADGAFAFAKNAPYTVSHRHFSHLLALHPLALFDPNAAGAGRLRTAALAAVAKLDTVGPSRWCGYSWSWLANIKARLRDGDGAARALRIFAEHFVLKNTFHANGDQTKQGYSNDHSRAFTLEGNFAFAAGVQEMLLQSHTGVVHVFPALPAAWWTGGKTVSFDNFRAQGAFIVSATAENGKITRIHIRSEKGGRLRLAHPQFTAGTLGLSAGARLLGEFEQVWQIETQPGSIIEWTTKPAADQPPPAKSAPPPPTPPRIARR